MNRRWPQPCISPGAIRRFLRRSAHGLMRRIEVALEVRATSSSERSRCDIRAGKVASASRVPMRKVSADTDYPSGTAGNATSDSLICGLNVMLLTGWRYAKHVLFLVLNGSGPINKQWDNRRGNRCNEVPGGLTLEREIRVLIFIAAAKVERVACACRSTFSA